ncbi:MAG TPA: SurA N-terminal domain-containing protein, partial [Thermoanaerobaculia bacterium]|nr:SurA N-terminal domain-containing protein [Thermoanaerobaculia bacterium]
MLQQLRDNFRHLKWTLWLVVAAFLIGLWILPDSCSRLSARDGAVAHVGSDSVSLEEFQRIYRNLVESARASFGERLTPELEKQLGLPRQALQQLINHKMLAQEARRMGLSVSDEELRRAILAIPAFKDESGAFIGEQAYQATLRRAQFPSITAFENSMREDLLVAKLRSALAANVFVSDQQVEERYRHQVERAKIRYVELPAANFASEITVADAELAPYFETHKEEYRRPEQRLVSYLLVDQNKLRASLEVPDSDLTAYYGAHKDEFTQQEQVRARHILLKVDDNRTDAAAQQQMAALRKRIEGGEDFAAVAKEASEDPGSKDRGGDLGFFGRGQMVPEFEQAAFGGQPGKLIGPVKTSFGYHLIEVLGRREGGLRPFEEVKNLIRARVQSDRAQGDAERKANELAAKIKKDGLKTDD